MDGPRLTEERLRHHLDARQPEREAMCLALLPLLGPYTREKPRRPKGGPDGARDIEAVFESSTLLWGAVGFRNGGGSDDAARKAADSKFREDLKSMLEENRQLQAFVFFTNVDLTPSQHEELLAHARDSGIAHVDIFDFERLRHALDSPEGLIARLQYLEIPMSPTEQATLVARFGRDLQRVMTMRLDRVERTLSDMEHFMAFHKPVFRFDVSIELNDDLPAELGEQAILIHVRGLRGHADGLVCCVHYAPSAGESQKKNGSAFRLTTWVEDRTVMKGTHSVISHPVSPRPDKKTVIASGWFPLMRVGSAYVRLIDLMMLQLEAICTRGIHAKLRGIALDVNGYELFKCTPEPVEPVEAPTELPKELAFNGSGAEWVWLVKLASRDCFFDPPRPSGRLMPLTVTLRRNG